LATPLDLMADQSFPAPFVKGFAGIAAIAAGSGALTAASETRPPHGLIACEIKAIMG
jgi:hypothetical protein